MILGLRLDSWRGDTRLAMDLPVAGWAWSEKYGELPSGVLTVGFPPDFWPGDDRLHPIYPMGQVLRGELLLDDRTTPLPAFRIQKTSPGVTVEAESLDGAIVEDPWPYPTSPPPHATILQEARRLADPLPVALDARIPDLPLPEGIAWPGDRDKALLELAEMRGFRWALDPVGRLVGVPLGNPRHPDHVYTTAAEITGAASLALARTRVTKATVTSQATGAGGDGQAPLAVVRRLTLPEYAPEVYGVIGKIASSSSGATEDELYALAGAMLNESGQDRDFSILPDPTLRAGEVVRLEVDRPEGYRETVTGRVMSHTLRHTGIHDVTVRSI